MLMSIADNDDIIENDDVVKIPHRRCSGLGKFRKTLMAIEAAQGLYRHRCGKSARPAQDARRKLHVKSTAASITMAKIAKTADRKKVMDTSKSTACPKCGKPTRIVKRVKDRERGVPGGVFISCSACEFYEKL